MIICFDSGKYGAAKGEGLAPSFIFCAQNAVDL